MNTQFYSFDDTEFQTFEYTPDLSNNERIEGHVAISSNSIFGMSDTDILKLIKNAAKYAVVDHYYAFALRYNKNDMKTIISIMGREQIDIFNEQKERLDYILTAVEFSFMEDKKREAMINYKELINTVLVECEKEKRAVKYEKAGRSEEIGYIYVIKTIYGFKIGKTKNLRNRMNVFGVQLPFKYILVYDAKIINYHYVEKMLHDKFKHKHINGEWFNLTPEDLEEIKRLCA